VFASTTPLKDAVEIRDGLRASALVGPELGPGQQGPSIELARLQLE
jgi:hypothetical protein